MTTIRFRSPVTKPLLKAGAPKPVPPDPRAYDTFRVTQQFESPDVFYQDGRTHKATDIGNFRCGDPVVAMAPGNLRRVKDNAMALGAVSNALGVIIDHGHGLVTEMWHLNGYSGPSSGQVAAGQQVGIVGRTGLGNVCHLHVEAKRDGIRFDPEPLMFGGSLTVEDDMKIANGTPLAQGIVGPGNRLRVDPDTIAGSKVIGTDIGEAKAYYVEVYLLGVQGQAYTLNGKAGSTYTCVGVFGQVWYVATPLVTDITQTPGIFPEADCTALENQIAAASTAVDGAARAITAAQRSLA